MKNTTLSIAAFVAIATTLSANSHDLGSVTITSAANSPQSIADTTSDLSVITAAELESKHITSVNEALSLIGGISVTSQGSLGSNSSVFLRGNDNKRTLVLIDGMRLQDPSSTSGANLSHLMIGDIKQIEVIKGAQSGTWGADAAAGVINIITKEAKRGTHAKADVQYGSFNTKKRSLHLSHKQQSFDISVAADKITSDGFSSQAPRGRDIDDFEDDGYENTSLHLKAGYRFNAQTSVNVNLMAVEALKEYDSFNAPDDATMKSDISNRLYKTTLNHRLNKHRLSFQASRSDFSRDEIGTVSTFFGPAVKVFEGAHTAYELKDRFDYMPQSFLLAGIGKGKEEIDYRLTDGTSATMDDAQSFAYLTNSNRFGDTVLTQSIRYDSYDNFDNRLTGKVGIKHFLTPQIYLASNYGTGYNVPGLMHRLNPWGTANLQLQPEDSKSFDATVGVKGFTLTYFKQRIRDLIQWDGGQYKNLSGTNKLEGFELHFQKELLPATILSASYTALSAKDRNGDDLPRRPEESLKAGIDYYGIAGLHLGVYGEYIGKRYDSTAKTVQTGRYTVLNATADYLLAKNVTIYAKVNNMTNRYYQSVDGYATAPRSYYAGMKVTF